MTRRSDKGVNRSARAFSLPETKDGGISINAGKLMLKRAREADALLTGPGLVDGQRTAELLEQLFPELVSVQMVVDAGALTTLHLVRLDVSSSWKNALLTPHAEEMASLMR